MRFIISATALMRKKKFTPLLLLAALLLSGTFCYLPAAAAATSENCIKNTVDEGQCKDCCDCLDDPAERQACRDACALNDFSENSDFITVDAPSVQGPNGDYSAAVALGSEQECKTYCDESDDIACGDRRFCRDTCNSTDFGNPGTDDPPAEPGDPQDPPPTPGDPTTPGGEMNIEQTLSDQAQAMTIAFDALAFLTGDLCSDTFLPPGKVADFSGFQYLRDNDPTGLGHNTDFVTIIAFNMLNLLTNAQIDELVTLATDQIAMINEYGYKRFPLIKAFRRLLEGDLPEGAAGLDLAAVKAYSAELYRLDGEISYDRAETLGRILRNLDAGQKSALDALTALGGIGNWDSGAQDPLRELHPGLGRDEHVAVMTYASEMYSWYAGSVEADTYFCPERQGTYFGSFYMKDMPAMGNENFTIPDDLTADMGDRFLAALTDPQAALVTDLVDIQRTALYGIVDARTEISTLLRRFMVQETVDEEVVLALAEKYGELDGEIIYNYATRFSAAGGSLSDAQKTTVTAIREEWNTIECGGAFLYSEPIAMPEIMDTDFLFGSGGQPSTDPVSVVATDASLTLLADGLGFAEGPAAGKNGILYFSDISADKVYRWSEATGHTVIREDSGGTNGLWLTASGTILACEGERGRVVSIDQSGNVTVLAETYGGLRLNEPNDLWADPNGGIFFTDPVYNGTAVQDGEHVYYISPANQITRVVSDMARPNGIIGSADGKTLFITDHGAGKTYRFTVGDNGSLSDKTLFTETGGDGMTLDSEDNLYLAGDGVKVFDPSGNLLETIAVPGRTTNVCFGGDDGRTLYITTVTSVYSLKMKLEGVFPQESVNNPQGVVLSKSVSNGMLTLTWNSVEGAEGYVLLAAPLDLSEVSAFPMGDLTTLSAPLWDSPSYYALIQATNRFGVVEYSNLITIP